MQSVAIFSLLLLVCTSTCMSVTSENTTCTGNYCPFALNNSINNTNATTTLTATSGSQPILTANMDNITNMNNITSMNNMTGPALAALNNSSSNTNMSTLTSTNTTSLTATSGSQPILTANMDNMDNITIMNNTNNMNNMTGPNLAALNNSSSNTNMSTLTSTNATTTLTATSGSQPILTANMDNITNMNNMTNNTVTPTMVTDVNAASTSTKFNNEGRGNALFHSGCFSDHECTVKIGEYSNPFACKHKGGKSWKLTGRTRCMKVSK